MRFWGIGANDGESNYDGEFRENDCAYISWYEEEAPTLYEMLKTIEFGDIIYIKSFTIKGNVVNIKGVGIVIGKKCYRDRSALEVKWLDDEIQDKISVHGEKNNVYQNTLYEEFNTEILEYLKEKYKKCLERITLNKAE